MGRRERRSRKPSAANSSSTPPDKTVFFIDRSLGRHVVADALRAAGASVIVHDDHFAADAPDAEWLKVAGREGWVVLTKDARIKSRINERRILHAAGMRSFILTSQRLTGPEMADLLIKALPRMREMLSSSGGSFVATVSRSGEVSLLP